MDMREAAVILREFATTTECPRTTVSIGHRSRWFGWWVSGYTMTGWLIEHGARGNAWAYDVPAIFLDSDGNAWYLKLESSGWVRDHDKPLRGYTSRTPVGFWASSTGPVYSTALQDPTAEDGIRRFTRSLAEALGGYGLPPASKPRISEVQARTELATSRRRMLQAGLWGLLAWPYRALVFNIDEPGAAVGAWALLIIPAFFAEVYAGRFLEFLVAVYLISFLATGVWLWSELQPEREAYERSRQTVREAGGPGGASDPH